jgi:hypothetical protein
MTCRLGVDAEGVCIPSWMYTSGSNLTRTATSIGIWLLVSCAAAPSVDPSSGIGRSSDAALRAEICSVFTGGDAPKNPCGRCNIS